MELHFTDTQTAFGHLSDKELRRAVFLFSVITKKIWVRTGKFLMSVASFFHIPYGWVIRGNIFSHFCGGETISQCVPVMNKLASFSISSILDYSAEGIEDEASFDFVRDEILKTISAAVNSKSIAFGVFKYTGMCSFALLEKASAQQILTCEEQSSVKRSEERAFSTFSAAEEAGIAVFVDAEETWIQGAIDRMVLESMRIKNKKRAVVFTTIQMYRTDSISMLDELISCARSEGFVAGVKLVRGAYMEKERKRARQKGYLSPIRASKEETDRAFNEAVALCIKNIEHIHVCIATHNEESCIRASALMHSAGLSSSDKRIWFAQLYGMSDHITFNLAASGYNTAKYLPYGPIRKVMPYLIRRAEENSSVSAQSNREIKNYLQELKRRREVRKHR